MERMTASSMPTGTGRVWVVWTAVVVAAVVAPAAQTTRPAPAAQAPRPAPAAQAPRPTGDLEQALVRVGQRLEQWYSRARTVVSRETVWIQPLGAGLTPSSVPRRLVFELRVDWDPARTGPAGRPEATVLRQELDADGPGARDLPQSQSGCLDPKPVSPEPLGFLLPARRGESAFSPAGTARVNGRRALVFDFRGLSSVPPEIQWTGECVSVALHGRSRGRIWVDAETYDVLRLTDRLAGTFEVSVPRALVRRGAAPTMVIEQAESTIRYRQVEFDEPREVLMLPETVETFTVIRGNGTRRYRVSQRLSGYQRYLTGARLLD